MDANAGRRLGEATPANSVGCFLLKEGERPSDDEDEEDEEDEEEQEMSYCMVDFTEVKFGMDDGGGERLMSVCAHEYMTTLRSRGLLRQVSCDLPRSMCRVNGVQVRTVGEFMERVRTRHASYAHAMLPFATQTTMAAPLSMMHTYLGRGEILLSGPGPLVMDFEVKCGVWSVNIEKQMRLHSSGKLLNVCVVYESMCDNVLVYWFPSADDAL